MSVNPNTSFTPFNNTTIISHPFRVVDPVMSEDGSIIISCKRTLNTLSDNNYYVWCPTNGSINIDNLLIGSIVHLEANGNNIVCILSSIFPVESVLYLKLVPTI